MLLSRLSLTHFRNYRRLEIAFDAPLTLLQGRNAQGKTNLLEAIFMLATSKAFAAGRVGLGTFDDTTEFDDLVLRGDIQHEEVSEASRSKRNVPGHSQPRPVGYCSLPTSESLREAARILNEGERVVILEPGGGRLAVSESFTYRNAGNVTY